VSTPEPGDVIVPSQTSCSSCFRDRVGVGCRTATKMCRANVRAALWDETSPISGTSGGQDEVRSPRCPARSHCDTRPRGVPGCRNLTEQGRPVGWCSERILVRSLKVASSAVLQSARAGAAQPPGLGESSADGSGVGIDDWLANPGKGDICPGRRFGYRALSICFGCVDSLRVLGLAWDWSGRVARSPRASAMCALSDRSA
jgi:hypothetical protein